jgi:GT2 family glycosyltransferase
MIWFFTPYAHDKKFLAAIDLYFKLVTNPNDWVVIMDGDTAFLKPNFGEVIKRYTELFPETGLFTCYASRCHYACQVPTGADMENDSIRYHKTMADLLSSLEYNQTEILDRKIAGHLMVIRKNTWTRIRSEVIRTAASKHILGVDTKISKAILASGLKIRLIRELYILHYLRLAEGFDNDKHLKP